MHAENMALARFLAVDCQLLSERRSEGGLLYIDVCEE
jgi:hypothetical protein